MYEILFVMALIAFIYGTIVKKVETTMVSGPMIFVLLGLLLSPMFLGVLKVEPRW